MEEKCFICLCPFRNNMPIMDSSAKPRGSTLSNLEVSKAVEDMKNDKEGSLRQNAGHPKLQRRNSISNHSGLLSPKGKKSTANEPFPGIKLHDVTDDKKSGALDSPETSFKKKKGHKLKEQFSGLFSRRSSSSSSHNGSAERLGKSSLSEKSRKEKDVQHIIKLQSFWRMCAAKKVKSCFSNHGGIKSIETSLKEIIKNEESYLLMLKTLKQNYIVPLSTGKKANSILIPGESISTLFPGIDYTITCHSNFLKKIQICVKNWPIHDFSFILLDHVKFLTEIYEKIPDSLHNAESLLQRLQKKQNFIDFCNSALKSHPSSLSRRSLKHLIASPLTYMYQFEEICRPLIYPLKPSLQFYRLLTVESISTQLGIFLQEKMEIQECTRMIGMLQHVIGQRDKDKLTTKSTRRFLRERALKVNSRRSRAFLFSDLLYITHVRSSTLKFTASYPLSKLKIINSRRIQKGDTIRCSYSVLAGEKEYKFSETCTNPSNSFLFLLEEYIRRSQDPVFGKPLEKAMSDPQSLPIIFKKTIYHLDRAEDKTNLFRKPGNMNVIIQLRIAESKFLFLFFFCKIYRKLSLF